MNWKTLVMTAGAISLLSGPAMAIELSNDDEQAHHVIIRQNDSDQDTMEISIEAGDVVVDICKDGCILQLEDGSEVTVTGSEEVTIDKEGFGVAE